MSSFLSAGLQQHLHIFIPSLDAVDLSSSSVVSLLSNLVRGESRRGVAHVVGLGTGAHVTTLLAQDNEMLVSTLWLSAVDFTPTGALAVPTLRHPHVAYMRYCTCHASFSLPRMSGSPLQQPS